MKIYRLLVALVAAVLTASSFAQGKIVLGKLGQATASTRIYAAPNTHSRVYYHLKPFTYLVVRPYSNGSWCRVLLQNGSDGYVVAEKVAQLPYNVTRRAPTNYIASRGGIAIRGEGTGVELAKCALEYQGTPYVWGGNDPRRGIDCSGLVQNVFGTIGVNLPRTAAEQALVGTPITRLEDLRAGDRLYFWSSKRNKIGHTGIYIGGGYFVHASSGKGHVTTSYLGEPYYRGMLVAARR